MSGRLISIHAPPRGATSKRTSTRKQFLNFNSRPSARGDDVDSIRPKRRTNFNSRPSARGDLSSTAFRHISLISIHAPPRGATSGGRIIDGVEIISIHAPPRGATAAARKQRHPVQISIHAPPRGATKINVEGHELLIFQFTPLREGRHFPVRHKGRAKYFNSRPSARGDAMGTTCRS